VHDHVGGWGGGRRRGCGCVFGFFSSILPLLYVPSSPIVWSTGIVAAGAARGRRRAPRPRRARWLHPVDRPTLPRHRGRAAKHTPRAPSPPRLPTPAVRRPARPPFPPPLARGTHRPAGRGGPSARRRPCLAGPACGDAAARAAGRQLPPLSPLPPRSPSAERRGGHVVAAAAAGRRRAVTAGVGDGGWWTAVAPYSRRVLMRSATARVVFRHSCQGHAHSCPNLLTGLYGHFFLPLLIEDVSTTTIGATHVNATSMAVGLSSFFYFLTDDPRF